MTSRQIIGSGGGGKGGGGGGGISEAADTLSSVAYARFVDLIGEGRIFGLVNGESSIYLDGVPLRSLQGTPNYRPFRWASTLGTQDQDVIPGFAGTQQENAVGVHLLYSSGKIIRAVSDADADSVRVTVSVNALSETTSEGKIQGATVSYRVSVRRAVSGTWLTGFEGDITGKTGSKYQRSHEINLVDLGPGPYQVAIERITPDSTSALLVNDLYWDSFTVINYERYTYPNSALVAVEIDARYFSQVPSRGYHVKGLLVRIPSNYNPVTRVYTGIWDGTFVTDYTNNPAWGMFDIMTHPRYGLGKRITDSQVNKWLFYSIGQYCDEMVPTGTSTNIYDIIGSPSFSADGSVSSGVPVRSGPMEPRFTLNCVINTKEDAYRVLNYIASSFRGMVYWATGMAMVTQDRPGSVSMQWTNANVVDGKFSYEGSSLSQRHTSVSVGWNDPSEDFKQKFEYVEDKDAIARYGVRPLEIVAFGCTSQSQARRQGLYLLITERVEKGAIKFIAGLDSARVQPGDIGEVMDYKRAGARWGGRIVSSTINTVTLDSPVTLSPGTYTLSVMAPDGSVVKKSVVISAEGTFPTLTVSVDFVYQPLDMSIWTLASTAVKPVTVKVINVKQLNSSQWQITTLEHNPSKFDAIEEVRPLDVSNYSFLSFGSPALVDGLVAKEVTYRSGDTDVIVSNLEVSWDLSSDPLVRGYKLKIATSSGFVQVLPEQTEPHYTLENARVEQYTVSVCAVYQLGAVGPVRSYTTTVAGVPPPPGVVPNFHIERTFYGGIEFRWTASSVAGDRTEVRLNGDSWENGIPLYSGNSDTMPYMWPEDAHYVFRARRKDAWGVYSEDDSTIEFDVVNGVISGDYIIDPESGEWQRSDGSITPWQRSIIDPESGLVIGYEDVNWEVTATLDTKMPWAVNFDNRNDRIATAPIAPVIAVDGTAVDHVLKPDGSADVSFEWAWTGDESSIDGFEVMMYASTSSTPYVVGTSPSSERVSGVPAFKRAMLAYGLNANSYLTWAVRAYRIVDPDVDASGVVYSAWAQPSITGEAPYQPAANVAFSGDLTGTISGIPVSNASTWQSTSTNFNSRNDRLSGTPAAPTTATDGTSVDHVINGNGSADVSFEWAWSGDESTIDGFEVLLYLRSSSGVYTIGTDPANEQVLVVPANKRAVLSYGISPQAYETWAVRSYRVVDPDINAAGVLRSAWVRPGGSGENPYRAASAVAFTGDLTGTINGIAVSNASTWQSTSTNFNSRNDRLSGTPAAPTTATDGTSVDHVINGNGSADVSFEWAWSGDESTIDGFEVLLYLSTASGTYTIGSNAAAEQVLAVPANKRAILVYGVSPTAYETWAVRAYRAVDPDVNSAGILRSAWVRPGGSGEDPYRPASSVAFSGDVTGTVGGIPAANVNQWSAISGINVVTGQISPGAVTDNFTRDSGAPTFNVAYGGTYNRVLYDPLSFTPTVNCTVDITIRLSCDAGVGWGGGTLAMAGAVPDSVTYTVRNDSGAHAPIYSFPAYTGWSDGYAVADTSHYHDWAAYVGAVAQFPPDRGGITLFASLALNAGTTYRIGLVALTGEDGGTVYEYQTSVVVRKR